jgi:glycosyltransferase involved in cell wall biosynthesis
LGKASIIGNSRQQGQFQERVLNVPEPCPQFDSTCSAAEARRHLSLPQDKCVLLFFGRLRWDKGIDILIEALQSLEEDFALVVAGQEGHMTLQQLEEARMRLPGTWELIAHIRHIDSEDVKYYFIAADAVLLPYRRAFRGTSGVLRNAAAAGKPVIASDVGEMGDIVRQYSLGLVVEPESQEALRDAIKFFVRERSKIAPHVREYALAYAEAHHWRRMAELVEEAFRGCSRARQNLEEAGGGAEMPAPWEQRRCARRS